ncbi:MAG: VWA domain-containing protein [Thermoleophilia bacterium]|nr:VWA domain-containing protein [Thermoleophilia bacterium]
MIWQRPEYLWLLPVVALVAIGMVLAVKRRLRLAAAYANPALVRTGVSGRTRTLRAAAGLAVLLALASAVVAMARPSMERTDREQRGTVVIAIDVSKSMLKTDLSPSRLGAALDAARRFVRDKPDGVQVGLVAFNKSAIVVQSPTTDTAALLDTLSRRFGDIDTGTAIGDAVVTGLASMQASGLKEPAATPDQSAYRMLLLSDGAQFLGNVQPQAAAIRARQLSVPVYTILLGDDPGLPGQATPVDTLGQLASSTGGVSAQTTTTADLQRVFADMGTSLVPVRRVDEYSAIPAGIAAGLLLIAAVLAVAGAPRGRALRASAA